MADIAEIGFRANTSELADAKTKLEALSPAAEKSERASQRLSKMLEGVNAAANKLTAAASGLSSAADKLTAAIGNAANANVRNTKATNEAAAATQKATAVSNAAAAAAEKEAAAVNNLAAARKRAASVPSISGGTLGGSGRGPWGMAADNSNVPGRGRGGDGILAAQMTPSNIAAQFQDIGVTAAMGMNPLLIALQQGTQLSMAFAGGLKGVGAALAMMLGPTALLTIAAVGLGAAMLQAVDWIMLAKVGLNALADILPVVAVGVTALGAAVTAAFAPAILTMFWNLFLTIAAGIIGLVGGIIAALGAVPIAIGLIIADLIIFRDEWAAVLGVDLVGIVISAVNYIIGAFVAAYHDIEFLWKNFPDIIGAAAIGAANMVVKAVNVIVGATVNGINTVISAANAIGNSAIAQKIGLGFEIDKFNADDFKVDEIANDAADRLANAVKGRNDQLQKDLTTDYLGAMAGAIGDAAEWASGKIRDFSAGLGLEKDKKKKKGGGKTDAEKFDDIIAGADRTIATMQAERDAIGLNELAAAKLRHETDLLNQAQQKGIELSAQQRDQLIAVAHGMAELEISTKRAKEALEFAKDTTKGFFSDLMGGLQQGKSLWESFANAALNAINKITDKLLNDLIDALFEVNSATGGGGGGLFSLIGGLFGLGGGGDPWSGLRMAKGGAFANGISGHSNSVVDKPTLFAFASGAGLMGEAGPEAIMPLKRGPDGSLGVQTYGNGGNGGGVQSVDVAAHVTVGWSRTADGNLRPFVEDVATQTTRAGIQQYDSDILPARVNEIADDPRAR